MVEVHAISGFARKTELLGLAADPCHSTGALTGRVSRLVNV
ncbi:hypothetical protein [Nocardiopsis nanhaiensis]